MIRAVLFDLDGTLIDSTDAIVESYFHAYDTLGAPRPPRERIIETIGIPLERQFESLGGVEVLPAVAAYRERYRVLGPEKTTLLPGVEESLDRLARHGQRIGFATSKRRYAAEYLLEHLGVLDRFEARVGPEDVAQPKPHPDVLYAALERLQLEPHEAVFVGDMEFDVLAGRAAGVTTLGVTTGYCTHEVLKNAGCELIFDSVSRAVDHILSLVNRRGRESVDSVKPIP